MSMYTLLRNNTMPSEEEMEKAFEGVAINIGYGFVHLLIIILQVTCVDVQDTDLFWMDTEHSAVKIMMEIVLAVKMNILEL